DVLEVEPRLDQAIAGLDARADIQVAGPQHLSPEGGQGFIGGRRGQMAKIDRQEFGRLGADETEPAGWIDRGRRGGPGVPGVGRGGGWGGGRVGGTELSISLPSRRSWVCTIRRFSSSWCA